MLKWKFCLASSTIWKGPLRLQETLSLEEEWATTSLLPRRWEGTLNWDMSRIRTSVWIRSSRRQVHNTTNGLVFLLWIRHQTKKKRAKTAKSGNVKNPKRSDDYSSHLLSPIKPTSSLPSQKNQTHQKNGNRTHVYKFALYSPLTKWRRQSHYCIFCQSSRVRKEF